jgi:hypothetical protein
MIIEKGHYEFVRAGLGDININLKDKSCKKIPLYNTDGITQVGNVDIVKVSPLHLDFNLHTAIINDSDYLSIVPQNFTVQNGKIVKVFTFKITSTYENFVSFPLNDQDFVKKADKN